MLHSKNCNSQPPLKIGHSLSAARVDTTGEVSSGVRSRRSTYKLSHPEVLESSLAKRMRLIKEKLHMRKYNAEKVCNSIIFI